MKRQPWAPTLRRWVNAQIREHTLYGWGERRERWRDEISSELNERAAWNLLEQIIQSGLLLQMRRSDFDDMFETLALEYTLQAQGITEEKLIQLLRSIAQYGDTGMLKHIIRAAKDERGIVIAPKAIMGLAQQLIDRRDFKGAALLALNTSHDWRVLSTRTIIEWLHRSIISYDGDHGMFRLYGMLIVRMDHIPKRTRAYELGVQQLAEAISVMIIYGDERWTAVLVERLQHLGPDGAMRVHKAIRKRMAEYTKARRTIMNNVIGPATRA